MITRIRALAATAVAFAFTACGGGGGSEPPVQSVNPVSPSYGKIQFVVGTANIAGVPSLNTMVTLRQPNGQSAVGYSTPTITWDGAFVNTAASSLDGPPPNVDDNLKKISGSLPVTLGQPGPISTFGQGPGSWGVFGYGFYPANSGPGNVNSSIVYPCLPVYSNFGTGYAGFPANTPGSTTPYCSSGAYFIGGPPAFPDVQNGSGNAGQFGATLGFTPFLGLAPAPNPATGKSTFNLSVQIPTGFNGNTPTYGTLSATAAMSHFTPLGTFSVLSFAPDGNGGGSFSYQLPTGVTEAYLFLVNLGPDGTGTTTNCNFGGLPFYYTVHVTASSPNPAGLGYAGGANDPGDHLGPNPAVGSLGANQSLSTLCSSAQNSAVDGAGAAADQYIVYAVGFDYPAYGSSYPNSSGNQTPQLAGPSGQADLTMSAISSPATYPAVATAIARRRVSR
ncbi:MAG: hypothetical protein ABI282_11920 [Candidatus Baltobacteraceae bacterium]